MESHWNILRGLFLDLQFKNIILPPVWKMASIQVGGQEIRTMRLLQLSGEKMNRVKYSRAEEKVRLKSY